LEAFPGNNKSFIDSNILIYHLLNDPVYGKNCKDFIGRIEGGDIEGYISPIIVSETLFSFIKAVIIKKYRIRPGEVVTFLKTKREVIYDVDIERPSELFEIFSVLSISKSEVIGCYDAVKSYAMLTNDALHLSTMNNNRIENIATNDSDFERVEGIVVWKP
jgi:hypothetical protein